MAARWRAARLRRPRAAARGGGGDPRPIHSDPCLGRRADRRRRDHPDRRGVRLVGPGRADPQERGAGPYGQQSPAGCRSHEGACSMNDVTSEQDRLEAELRQTRSRMDERLTELRDRMTPGQILDDLTGYLRGSQGAEFANNLMATLRSNPVPAALTGIGLVWLMASGARAPALA